MAETDTIERPKSRKVQVASLPPGDSGRGFARLPESLMEALGIREGDVIEITGKRSTGAIAIRPYGEDEGIDIIRLDGLQRANAGVGSGDFVEVGKGEFVWREPGTRHVAWTPEGALVLAMFQVPNKFFESDGRVTDSSGEDWEKLWGALMRD